MRILTETQLLQETDEFSDTEDKQNKKTFGHFLRQSIGIWQPSNYMKYSVHFSDNRLFIILAMNRNKNYFRCFKIILPTLPQVIQNIEYQLKRNE